MNLSPILKATRAATATLERLRHKSRPPAASRPRPPRRKR